jgi:hypothetical protein
LATSLVDELQFDALNGAVSVSSLLRKVLLVAAKLEVSDIPEWVNKELSGYGDDDSLPPYRILYGTVNAKTFQGWIPVQFPTNEMQDKASRISMYDPVAEIEALIRRENGTLVAGFPPEFQRLLRKMFEQNAEFIRVIEQTHLTGILDEIRNQVLRWAIALDKAGIKGDGLTFTGAEKERAHSMVFHVDGGNFNIGIVGGTGGQANVAAGSNARINIQSTDNSVDSVICQPDQMGKLAEQFASLRAALLSQASDAEHYASIGAIASAEIAAKEGSASNVAQALSALGAGGKWVVGIARDIGAELATAALKSYVGL